MERPKQLGIFKRHRGRGFGERKVKQQNRETRVNFWRHSTRSYLPTQKGVSLKKRHDKRRAKAKRSKMARKVNR